VLVVLLGTSAPVAAAEFDRGRALYENHCQLCHEDWAHTREGRVVVSLDGLRARVVSWSVHSGLRWRAEEIDEVTEYLNRRFYQLTR
jgi:mono/diheme cytochrome c family protein